MPELPLTLDDAKSIMEEYLDRSRTDKYHPLNVIVSVIDELHQIGGVFYYDDIELWIAGNAPIIIDKNDGSFNVTGTARPTEEYIDEYILADYPQLQGTQPVRVHTCDPSKFRKKPFDLAEE